MGKSIGTIGWAIAAIALFCYLVSKVWSIFGAWPLIISVVINLFAETVLGQLIGSKKETPHGHVFNPKELPKFMVILIALLVGVYLYDQLNSKNIDEFEHDFGVMYLVVAIVLPIARALYMLIRDRNDFVEIDGDTLKYRNNNDCGEISLKWVKQIHLVDSDLRLMMKNGQESVLKTSEMNFNARDLMDIVSLVNLRIPPQD